MYSIDLKLTVHINICLETLNKQTKIYIKKSPFTLFWSLRKIKTKMACLAVPQHLTTVLLRPAPGQPSCCLAVAYKLLLVFMSTGLEGVCLVPSCSPPFACVYPAQQHWLQSAQEDTVSPGRQPSQLHGALQGFPSRRAEERVKLPSCTQLKRVRCEGVPAVV